MLSDIEMSINEASSHYEIWWALGFSENREKYRDVFEHADFNYFLHTSYVANEIAMFMALSRTFDSCDKSSRMRELKVQLNEAGIDHLAKDIDEALLPHQSIVKKVLDIRSQLIAHTQMDQTDSSVLKRNGITPKEIKELIETAKAVLMKVSSTLRVNNLCYKKGFHNESTLHVLSKLKV